MAQVTPGAAPGPAAGATPAATPGVVHVLRPDELVVGARVVVRHRLADGRASDALGDLVAADDVTLRIATRRGAVDVARADVLAAKAVPPPPRRRGAPHAAIGVDDLERTMVQHWRPLERAELGDWWLRASEGFTGRANSALAVGSPGMELPAALARVEAFYARHGLRALVAVPHEAGTSGEHLPLVAELAARGWTVRTPTLVLTAATDDLPGAGEVPLQEGLRVTASVEPDQTWLAQYHYQGAPEVPAAGRQVLVSADEQVFLRVLDGERTVAVARGSLSPGWAGITAVETAPSHRRRGLGRRLLAEVADWARTRGATSTYLQVSEDNTPARSLYTATGFTAHHAYHYRVAPAG